MELVISETLEERGPGEDTRWSTRSMAAATGMSQPRPQYYLAPLTLSLWPPGSPPRQGHSSATTALRTRHTLLLKAPANATPTAIGGSGPR